jgi:hypothetical protein
MRRCICGLLAALVASLSLWVSLPSSSLAATNSAEAIAWLNAQREANGIPGGITDNPTWDASCRLHMTWLKLNPDVSGLSEHEEEPGTPGYTPEGAWAGEHSVLGGTFLSTSSTARTAAQWHDTYPWGASDGWEWAPIHLMDLLNPSLAVTGFAPGCMITGEGPWRPEPATPELFTYPGAGTSWIYPAEVAYETPYTPGEFVGLPQPTSRTGPYLYVLGWGTGTGAITSASLTGPSGPVAISTVDDDTSGPPGRIGEYLGAGGVLIPRKPLEPYTRYTASATFVPNEGGSPLSTTWSFETGPFVNYLMSEANVATRSSKGADRVALTVTSSSPNPRVLLNGPHHLHVKARLVVVGYATPDSFGAPYTEYNGLVTLRRGIWKACSSSGGTGTDFASARECETLVVGGSAAHHG